jgi:hypothetical protein
MSAHCARPIAFEELAAYWTHDLTQERSDELEEHFFACDSCARASERIAAMVEAFRTVVPPLLRQADVERLRARGVTIVENPMLPGERREVLFPAGVDVLLHSLTGLELGESTRVSFTLSVEGTDRVLMHIADAPFDRDAGAVLVACQMHFADLPHDTVAELRTFDAQGRETVHTYTILHRF